MFDFNIVPGAPRYILSQRICYGVTLLKFYIKKDGLSNCQKLPKIYTKTISSRSILTISL